MRKAGPPREVPPPLELVCLNALWKLGEGNTSDVKRALEGVKPLAYTTVMTLLERLTKKGVLGRQKKGRAFIYTPKLMRDDLRRTALREFVDAHFDGDERAMRDFLSPQKAVAANGSSSLDATLL